MVYKINQKFEVAYIRIMDNLKKYSVYNKIPISRAKVIISTIHRFPKPYNTKIISELSIAGWIKLKNGSGYIELIK